MAFSGLIKEYENTRLTQCQAGGGQNQVSVREQENKSNKGDRLSPSPTNLRDNLQWCVTHQDYRARGSDTPPHVISLT